MLYCFSYEFIGRKVFIYEKNGYISEVSFGESPGKDKFKYLETKLIKDCALQLKEYFEGKRKVFHIPVNPEGTDFQKKVWDALKSIPYGETRSYKEIAEKIGNKNASRAVGGANNKNPIGIIIPCHRVIGANGKLIGYAGGLELKKELLNLEKKFL